MESLIKQIWLDYGLRTHELYIVDGRIMDIVKDKMTKEMSEVVCLAWQLIRGYDHANQTHNNSGFIRSGLFRW